MKAWKCATDEKGNLVVIELTVPDYPESVKLNYGNELRGRAPYAIVDKIYRDGVFNIRPEIAGPAVSLYNMSFTYYVGKKVVPDSFDPDPDAACSHGINFFESFTAALDYGLHDLWATGEISARQFAIVALEWLNERNNLLEKK